MLLRLRVRDTVWSTTLPQFQHQGVHTEEDVEVKMKLTCLLSSITCIFVLVFPIVLSSGVFEKHQSEATPLWQLGANIHHQQDGSAITSRLYSKRDGGTSTHVDLVQDLSNVSVSRRFLHLVIGFHILVADA